MIHCLGSRQTLTMAVEGSWPVIKAFLRFTPIATHLNKKTASRLIEDSEEEMRNADLTTAWPNYLAGMA
jgi:hypothetical protein